MSLVLSDQRPPPSILSSATYAGKAGDPTPNNFWLPATGTPLFNNVEVTGTLQTGSLTVTGDITVNDVANLTSSLTAEGNLNVKGQLACASFNSGPGGFTSPGGIAQLPAGLVVGQGTAVDYQAIYQVFTQGGGGNSLESPQPVQTSTSPFQATGNKVFISKKAGQQARILADPRLTPLGGGAAATGYVVNYTNNSNPQTYSTWNPDGSVDLTVGAPDAVYGIFYF